MEDEILFEIAAFVVNDLLGTSPLISDPELFGLQNVPVRNPNYFEDTINHYTDEEFRQHFRMTRKCFDELLVKVDANSQVESLEKKLLFTVWMLSKQESFLSAGDRFNFAKSTSHAAFCEVLEAINNLSEDYIKWPSRNEYDNISESFRQKTNGKIPGIVGAIDGCHIQMKQPIHNPIDYYNRKNTHSIILQAVCDHRTVFTDIFVGAPGRLHDARVFRNSELCKTLQDKIPPEYHILGDAAYPLMQNLQTPFRDNGHLRSAQSRFNTALSSGRVVIERSFGLLKGRFRRLKYLDVETPKMAIQIVVACVILHNHIQLFNDDTNPNDFLETFTEGDSATLQVSVDRNTNASRSTHHRAGESKRSFLLSLFEN